MTSDTEHILPASPGVADIDEPFEVRDDPGLAARLAAGLDDVRRSPVDGGTLELIVARGGFAERDVLTTGELDEALGLVGDSWHIRPSRRTEDGSPHPDMQLNIINSRALALMCPDPARRPLAGDQLHVDLHLGPDVLRPGTRLAIGSAVIEITDQPHRGCPKFSDRYGLDALRLVNSPAGKALNLRGVNAKVVRGGTITTGDTIRRV